MSTRAALHEHSCSSPWALMQLSTSTHGELHEAVCSSSLHDQFARPVCATSLHDQFALTSFYIARALHERSWSSTSARATPRATIMELTRPDLHAPTPYHMFPPLPHVSVHALGLTPYDLSRPLPHAPTPCHHPCHMSPHPATCPHTLPHTPGPCHIPPTLGPTPHVPKPKVKKTLEELHEHSCSSPRALMQLSTSARAALHQHSWRAAWAVCTSSLHDQFAHS